MARESSKSMQTQVAAQRTEQDPFREMIGFRDTINGMFEDFFSGRPLLAASFSEPSGAEERGWTPPVDIREDQGDIVVRAGLFGVKKDDCLIEVKDNTLFLSGEVKEEGERAENWLRRELPYGRFYRAFTLPADVKADQIKARYADGVLEIRLPKSEESKPRTVAIE